MRRVLRWIRALLAAVGLGESSIDKKVREARAAFKDAMSKTDRDHPNDG